MRLPILTLLAALIFVPNGLSSYAFAPDTTGRQATATWKRYSIEKSGLSLELPSAPRPSAVPIPEEVGSKVRSMQVYQATSSRLVAMCMYSTYTDGIQANLEGAAAGAINNVKNSLALTNFRSTTKRTRFCGLPAIMIEASFVSEGYKMRLNHVIAVKGSEMWQINGVYLASDSQASRDLQRIFKSARIEPQQK